MFLDPLGIIGDQSCKDEYTGIGGDPVQGGAVHENIHDGSDDETHKEHDQDVPEFGEVISGEISVSAHHGKDATRDKERGGNGSCGIDQEES